MGYDHFFRFIKDDLIDPNIAFTQNVDNFLFCIYFNYLDRYENDIKEERNIILSNLFRVIKNLLMCKYTHVHGGCFVKKLIDLKYNNNKLIMLKLKLI